VGWNGPYEGIQQKMQESRPTKYSTFPVRVLLVDDHAIVRRCLRTIIEKQPDIDVIGEAQDGREAVDLVREVLPDIVIMDVDMLNLNGMEVTRQILSEFTQVKIIALSARSDRLHVAEMLRAGASAYVLKECIFGELVEAMRTTSRGETYLCPKIIRTVIGDYIRLLSQDTCYPLEKLSTREREVLQLLSEGKSTKQIALELHVSTKAIEANRREIMEKLDTYSVAKLVKFVIKGGATSLE
jgi:DNA-binding NarL/FixJ family response regulator